MTSRRTLLKGALGVLIASQTDMATAAAPVVNLRIDPTPRNPISKYVFGSNEFGNMEGPEPSITYDGPAGITFRRLGGNLSTAYNWVNNATNAGHDWKHENGYFWPGLLGMSEAQRNEPAAVIAAAHANSQSIGAKSLITLQLAGFVAADADGPVPPDQTAPSKRFVPLLWSSDRSADAPIDRSVADMPQLLRRLVQRYGRADTATGIYAYALDNEPGLWAQNHPRIVPRAPTIRDFLARSIAAARAIRAIDPSARIFGPASWGATEFHSFQNATDWSSYATRYDSFLSAYLDAFRIASEQSGVRLLDALDVHWYPFSKVGDLLNSVNPAHAQVLLAAPRTLTDPDFNEDSWVASTLALRMTGGLSRPILPSLHRLIDRWYPGTDIAITEFNFGGRSALVSGLAVADALGRFADGDVRYAAHWGNISGWIGEAYRLYRNHDGQGGQFAGRSLAVACDQPELVAAHAAQDGEKLSLVLINKSEQPVRIALAPTAQVRALSGFDGDHSACGPLPLPADPAAPLILPPRAARLAVLG